MGIGDWTQPNFIFIILVEDEYSEELVFELIDKINEEKIITMINEETQELNPNGRVELKTILDVYQKKNDEENNGDLIKDKETNNDSKLKIDDKKNNENEVRNQSAEIEDLQTKNDVFLLTDKKRKWDLSRLAILRDYKVWIYMGIIVLVILFIIILA